MPCRDYFCVSRAVGDGGSCFRSAGSQPRRSRARVPKDVMRGGVDASVAPPARRSSWGARSCPCLPSITMPRSPTGRASRRSRPVSRPIWPTGSIERCKTAACRTCMPWSWRAAASWCSSAMTTVRTSAGASRSARSRFGPEAQARPALGLEEHRRPALRHSTRRWSGAGARSAARRPFSLPRSRRPTRRAGA